MLRESALLLLLIVFIAVPATAEDRGAPEPFKPDGEFWLGAATDDIEQGLLSEASRAATEAIRLKETKGYYVRALVAFKKNEMKKALDDCDKALEVERNEGARRATLRLRAAIHLKSKHLKEAVADCDYLIEVDGDCADYYRMRSICHWNLRDWDRALADAVRVIDAEPDDYIGYYLRARIRVGQKQYRLALIDFRRAAELCNEDLMFIGLVGTLISCPTKQFNDYNGAIELIRGRCESTNWEECVWISLLASIYAEAGDFSHAVEYAKRATSLTTADDSALADRNLQLFKDGKTLGVFSNNDLWMDARVPSLAGPAVSQD